jgi:hypothetical protein
VAEQRAVVSARASEVCLDVDFSYNRGKDSPRPCHSSDLSLSVEATAKNRTHSATVTSHVPAFAAHLSRHTGRASGCGEWCGIAVRRTIPACPRRLRYSSSSAPSLLQGCPAPAREKLHAHASFAPIRSIATTPPRPRSSPLTTADASRRPGECLRIPTPLRRQTPEIAQQPRLTIPTFYPRPPTAGTARPPP